MSSFDLWKLCYGFDLDKLPMLSVDSPCNNVITFIANMANVRCIARYPEDYVYIGIEITQFDYSCDFFDTYNHYIKTICDNKEKYNNKIISDIKDIISVLSNEGLDFSEEYDFSEEQLNVAIEYFKNLLKNFKPDMMACMLSFSCNSG